MPRRAARPGGGAAPGSLPAAGAPFRLDPYRGAPEARAWREALAAGRWEPVQEGLAAIVDPPRRELVVERLTADGERVPGLDSWVDATGSPEALLVRGAQGISWAWSARAAGSGLAEADALALFFRRLRAAEHDLFEAVALDAGDPVVWGQLVRSGRALEISMDERWARYRRATPEEPPLPGAADHMLQAVCAKWGGSHEAMFEFAVSTSEAAPAGHPVHRLVAMAVIERRVASGEIPEWRAVRDAMPDLQRWLYDAAGRSIDLPGFASRPAEDPQRLLTLNVFACAFAQMNHLDRLRWTLERIDLDMTEVPWSRWGGEQELRRVRQLVKLA